MTNPAFDLDAFASRHHGFVDATAPRQAWITAPPADLDACEADASAHGLQRTRTLYQMRVALPVPNRPDAPAITTRPIDIERDGENWVRVNNAAFSWHPDQGNQHLDDLLAATKEPWFDADGFRILDGDGNGELAGFCWTKVHDDETPALGEIYVIATAPEFAGRGLGLALTLDGLDYLHDVRGTTVGMLYVEADNAAALRTYERIGFHVHATRVAYAAHDATASSTSA